MRGRRTGSRGSSDAVRNARQQAICANASISSSLPRATRASARSPIGSHPVFRRCAPPCDRERPRPVDSTRTPGPRHGPSFPIRGGRSPRSSPSSRHTPDAGMENETTHSLLFVPCPIECFMILRRATNQPLGQISKKKGLRRKADIHLSIAMVPKGGLEPPRVSPPLP